MIYHEFLIQNKQFAVTHTSTESYTSPLSSEQPITSPHSDPNKCSPHMAKQLHQIIFHYYYSLTPYSTVLLEKLTGFQLVKKLPTFYGTRRFIIAVTSARHLAISCASSIQPISSHPTSWRYILISSSHLCPGLPSGLSVSFSHKNHVHVSPPFMLHAKTHRILLDFITRPILGEQYRSLSSSLCSFLHSPVTSSQLGPNVLLNILFSNILSLWSSININDQVWHPYKQQAKL